MTTQSNATEPETAIDGQDVATVEELTQWADQVEGERDAMIETIAELERERDALRMALIELAEKADRASLVQDRSVGIIKQACAYIAKEARAVLGETK